MTAAWSEAKRLPLHLAKAAPDERLGGRLRRAELPDRATRVLLRFWQRIANKLACRIRQRIAFVLLHMFLGSIATLQATADMLAKDAPPGISGGFTQTAPIRIGGHSAWDRLGLLAER